MLRQIADEFLCFVRFLKNIVSVNQHLAGAGGQATGDDVHGGGFTGTVGPQKAVNMTFGDFKGNVVHSQMVAIILRQMLNGNQAAPPVPVKQFVASYAYILSHFSFMQAL